MVDRKWEGNGNSSLEEIPVSHVNHILSAGSLNSLLFLYSNLAYLTVLWLTRELACLYFVADILSSDLRCILLFCYSGTELFLMLSWFFGSGLGGNGK